MKHEAEAKQAKKHKWKWSDKCDGTGQCKVCGQRIAYMQGVGPKGGSGIRYLVGDVASPVCPPCPSQA